MIKDEDDEDDGDKGLGLKRMKKDFKKMERDEKR